jgi:hypothetical protein
MSARATTVAQGFSNKLLKEMYERSLTDAIVNRDYQGEINGVGSKLNILNIGRISEQTYSGANLTVADLTEFNAVLTIDQYKSFYWKEKDLDNWLSYIKDPHATVVAQKADERAKNMDEFVLALYADAGAGIVGTNYITGDVTINSAGAVTGNGTTFLEAWVGKPFKATGHSKWYRVATYTSGTAITIENNEDDVASHYDGGAIGGGSTYIIQGVTAVSITTANLLQKIADLKQILDEQDKYSFNAVPDMDRFLIVPPEFYNTLVRASGIVLHVPEVYTNLIQKGYLGDLLGFKLFQSSRLTGNNTTGYHIIGGSPLWCTFAEKLLDADIEEDLIANFGSAYKDLFVYGAKVADSRRHMAGQIFATFA